MNEGLGEERLTAHWAVLGKHPGQTMGYEVLRSSLPDDRASTYLWKASATGAPGGRDPEGELPWRVFLGGTDTHPEPVCACVETTWDGSTDGTGAPSYAWRLTLLEWAEAGRAALTWSGIDRALLSDPPALPGDAVPMTVAVPGTPPAELAEVIDQLGFDWAAGVAALLLGNRQVAITPSPGKALPDVTDRVRVLDAVCSLLPYECRAWLSAATWTGPSQHDLRLFFASAARTGQVTSVLGGSPPGEPRDETARAYLHGLRRLRAKTGDTTEIVAYLLTAAVEPAAAPRPGAALRTLREADLMDVVVEEIRSGGGQFGDVRRVLERYPAASLNEHRLGALTLFLVRCAHGGNAVAGSLLGEHWSERTPSLLVREVLGAGTPTLSFERAKQYLGVVHNTVEACRPGSFDELFSTLVEAPEATHEWTGTLIYMADNEWGRHTDGADRLLVSESAVGKTWLKCLLDHEDRSLAPLHRLVQRARDDMAADVTPGWLRFAAVLLGESLDLATATDAAEFAGALEGGGRITLEIARAQRRPEVLALMWPRLWRVARTERGLGEAVEQLVPVGEPQTSGIVAADADLFCAAVRGGATAGMPRLERLTAEEALHDYVSVLIRRIESDGELRRVAVEALLGGELSGNTWWAIEELSRALPDSLLRQLCEELHRRLTGRGRPLNDLDVPEYLMEELEKRYDLGWLRPVRDFRKAAQDQGRAPYQELARIVLEAHEQGRLPAPLLDAIAAWTLEVGADGLERVAWHMDGLVAGFPGLELYAALARGDRHGELRDQLMNHSEIQKARHEWILTELQGRQDSWPPPPGTATERRGVLKKISRHLPGGSR
ncbi:MULTISPECIES: hypothetical protein [unclassified Streptomyces]|uniref:hypothetical protein n=1 Tax=unclassified Streptomyces TaxID=2593676 RepID=UPI002E80BD9E|nr:hypothetical protein [Streptomyces sp. NBC_00589]WTI35561.1 hypothetical protein OIC96_11415 [Streptomyces sp. NBC_00775]WUB30766.1 hypothetical protein OHA51_38315 [Streptomyces sp. NBC_00589]